MNKEELKKITTRKISNEELCTDIIQVSLKVFGAELTELIQKHDLKRLSQIPDIFLSEFLVNCAFNYIKIERKIIKSLEKKT